MENIPDMTKEIAHAGELLIRAAAVLGTLTEEQQQALRQATDGALPDCLIMALQAAQKLSPQDAESMRTHPPVGLVGLSGS